MKRFILLPLLLSSCMQSMPPKEIKDNEHILCPIQQEPVSRFGDKDLCEIVWDKELRDLEDHPTPDLGQPSPADNK